MYMCAQSYPTLSDRMNCTHQALLSVEFSSKKYWSRLPFPPPGDLPDPGIKPVSLVSPALIGGFFATCATWEQDNTVTGVSKFCLWKEWITEENKLMKLSYYYKVKQVSLLETIHCQAAVVDICYF